MRAGPEAIPSTKQHLGQGGDGGGERATGFANFPLRVYQRTPEKKKEYVREVVFQAVRSERNNYNSPLGMEKVKSHCWDPSLQLQSLHKVPRIGVKPYFSPASVG